MFNSYWRKRAERAEAEAASLRDLLASAVQSNNKIQDELAGVQLRLADRAVLISMAREDGSNRFVFLRNGETFTVETYATMGDRFEAWKQALLSLIAVPTS